MYKTDRLIGQKGGVAILVFKKQHCKPEVKNEHFITDTKTLAIEMELQNGNRFIFTTISLPEWKTYYIIRLFRRINALSNHVKCLEGFNPKHRQFRCVKPNLSGPILVDTAKDFELFLI